MGSQPITVVVIGGGARGELYAKYALEHPDKMKVIAVAEPREAYRQSMAEQHNISSDKSFTTWEEVIAAGKMADAVMICTQDRLHTEPAIAFAKQKYNILLEKPMSPSADECREIVKAAEENEVIFSVCHVLRYTQYTTKLKSILNDGLIGDVVSMQHLEPVGWWHQAHSFVRGNWRNEEESAFMLLAKACHDLDWIRFIMDEPVESVHSFGGLYHFKEENKPQGAGKNCFDCDVESTCPYSAKKIYIENEYGGDYFKKIITPEEGIDAVQTALENGPYGRCVYQCDNDVVDHQVVNLQFNKGKSASFTMTAFTEYAERKTRIFGTHGQLEGDGKTIKVLDFTTGKESIYDVTAVESNTSMSGHGGGDYYMMQHFIDALIHNDPTLVLSGPKESLETHLTVFAAEESRHSKKVIDVTL
ncbi:Gfo/Idh/MocA family oxidoreductase [Vibrio sp. SS-MA-C1-2]|uniref:Gfo/Idh/MocA family protein n=1 Tax=Vibrio sp. SS-MA-C1-2 TaxID=2908646 RepID=UPI001F2D56C2|nr:Gfo/Idh/MocA family oxidoreductase [Vibrio sp. SS-MA-C1-2]UJF20160.1 Gfo/Idh/MocA family oxidoreductase [Vibrio sp. SS-MA-C1-2]